jgi:methionine-rich copper-binding protein CopC
MKTSRYIALCGLLLMGVCLGTARGHAFPKQSEPRVGSTVAVPPTRVRIWFDYAVEPACCTIRVENESGQPIDRGDAHVDSSDITLFEVSLPPLSPGPYHLPWLSGQPPVRVAQGIIKTGVPTWTTLNSSSMALFCTAMQPRVQSFWQPPPWMNICPPRAVLEGGNLIASFACLIKQ